MIPIAILCGGLGTRLGKLTKSTPKSLVKVAGKPFLFWQLEMLQQHGFTEIVLCTGYLGNLIAHEIADAQRYSDNFKDLDIHIATDPRPHYGTANAIRRAFPLKDTEFCTLYGDSYLECDYESLVETFLDTPRVDALMTTYAGVDYGLGVFRRQAFIDTFDQSEIKDVYGVLERYGRLLKVEMPEPWKEMGSPQGLKELDRYLLDTKIHG